MPESIPQLVVRAVEVVYAIEESLRIIADYERPARPFVDVPARAGIGHGVSEAPRGLLYHRYEIGDDGLIRAATIVPPTAQNRPPSSTKWPSWSRPI